jgi:L-2-hydroxyglutarate oxidase LhgO
METVDTVVIGAGVVGLACAYSLARDGREVVVIERETAFGTGISARNSEVIHAGHLLPGRIAQGAACASPAGTSLYDYCAAARHQLIARCGKLIVASAAKRRSAALRRHCRPRARQRCR